MSLKKPTLKQRYAMSLLLKSMEKMLEKQDPYLSSAELQERYYAVVRSDLEEFIKNPFFLQ